MKIIDINGSEREAQKVYPDPLYPGFMRIQFKRYHEWYTLDEFVKFNPTLKNLLKGAPEVPEDIVGVVSRAGANFLVDANLDLKPNAYLNFTCWISRGKGEAQKRLVVENTKNKLVVDKPWAVRPNTTSQYVLSHNVQDVKAMGNTLPVEDMKELERRALKMDRDRDKLTSGLLKKNYKYLKPEDIK